MLYFVQMVLSLSILFLVAFAASLLTFYTGFGLGTLLTPIFMIYFPVETAIALTGVVHLANNVFKLSLIGFHADRKILFQFGIPAVCFAIFGAWLLLSLPSQVPLLDYQLYGHHYSVYSLKFVISLLIALFVCIDIWPMFKNLQINRKYLPFGGMLSGFFGGLSGHQGALRSAFLIKSGLSKEAFIGTTVVISTFVDITRLSIYGSALDLQMLVHHKFWIISAISGAISGAFLGLKTLKKVTITLMEKIIAGLLLMYSLLMAAGFL